MIFLSLNHQVSVTRGMAADIFNITFQKENKTAEPQIMSFFQSGGNGDALLLREYYCQKDDKNIKKLESYF